MRKAQSSFALTLFLLLCFWSWNQHSLVHDCTRPGVSLGNSSSSAAHPESVSTNSNQVDTARAPYAGQRGTQLVQRRKIAILSYNDARQGHKFLADPVLAGTVRCNHKAYAHRYGYHYISPERNSTTWSASRFILNGLRYKTFSILSNFDEYDILVWIDHDAVFFNQDLSVEYWLDEVMSADSDILMAEDLPGYKFNAGLQIIKTTPWTRNFYESAVDEMLKTSTNATYLEQPIFYRLYDQLEGAKQKLQIHKPRNEFQAFLKVKTDFKSTSWVVHGTFCDACDLVDYVRDVECKVRNDTLIDHDSDTHPHQGDMSRVQNYRANRTAR